MNDLARISIAQLRAAGIPFKGLPENPPQKDGCALFARITNDNKLTFAVAVDDPDNYRAYRTKTKRPGDHGSYIFRKMELLFVPEDQLYPGGA